MACSYWIHPFDLSPLFLLLRHHRRRRRRFRSLQMPMQMQVVKTR